MPPNTHISFWEGVKMLYGNRDVFDPVSQLTIGLKFGLRQEQFGWSTAIFEWGATYLMIWPADGKLSKDDVKAVYDVRSFAWCQASFLPSAQGLDFLRNCIRAGGSREGFQGIKAIDLLCKLRVQIRNTQGFQVCLPTKITRNLRKQELAVNDRLTH